MIGQFLRHERLEVGFSIHEVSKFLGIPKEQIISVENGLNAPKKIFVSLCNFYGLDVFSIKEKVNKFKSEHHLIHGEAADNHYNTILQFNNIKEELMDGEVLITPKGDKIKNLIRKRELYSKI